MGNCGISFPKTAKCLCGEPRRHPDIRHSGSVREHQEAAHSLGMPISTVSRLLWALQSRLGVSLRRRTTQRPTLTARGRGYFDQSQGCGSSQACPVNSRHHVCARPAFRVSEYSPRETLRATFFLQTQLASGEIVKHHARATAQMPKVRGAIWVTSIFEAIQVTDVKGGIDFVGPSIIGATAMGIRLAPYSVRRQGGENSAADCGLMIPRLQTGRTLGTAKSSRRTTDG
jgi:hypothetical protein